VSRLKGVPELHPPQAAPRDPLQEACRGLFHGSRHRRQRFGPALHNGVAQQLDRYDVQVFSSQLLLELGHILLGASQHGVRGLGNAPFEPPFRALLLFEGVGRRLSGCLELSLEARNLLAGILSEFPQLLRHLLHTGLRRVPRQGDLLQLRIAVCCLLAVGGQCAEAFAEALDQTLRVPELRPDSAALFPGRR
jgi:hypothetical protein